MKHILIGVVSASLAVALHGQTRTTQEPDTPPTLTDIATARTVHKQKAAVNEALNALQDLRALGHNVVEGKRLDCLSAVGHATFCTCVTAELPMAVSFTQYVGIVTRTKTELEYDTLGKNDKLVADATYAAREVCVDRAFRKH